MHTVVKPTAVILEDMAVIAIGLKELMESLGFVVVGMCASGQQAVAMILDKKPSLALIDIGLRGGMDGIEVAIEVGGVGGVPVVFVSGKFDSEILERASVVEAAGFVAKPFTVESLQVAVEMTLRQHRSLTGRREAELAKSEAITRLVDIVAHSHDAIVTVDEHHRIVIFNQSAERLFGYAETEVIGKSLDMLVPDNVTNHHQSMLQGLAKVQGKPWQERERLELEGRRQDGTIFPMEAGVSKSTTDGMTMYTAVVRDLTSEQELAAATLREQQLAATSDLALSVVHQLNSMLTVVSCYVQILRDDLDAPNTRSEALLNIDTAVARGAALSHRLMSYVRDTSESGSLNQVLENVRFLVERLVPVDVKIAWEVESKLRATVCKRRFEQLVLNLVINAVEAMGGEGELSIEARSTQIREHQETCCGSLAPGEYCKLVVHDSGPGISPDCLAHVLESFHASNPTTGLDVVALIVKEHEGALTLCCGERGLQVSVYLPAVVESKT